MKLLPSTSTATHQNLIPRALRLVLLGIAVIVNFASWAITIPLAAQEPSPANPATTITTPAPASETLLKDLINPVAIAVQPETHRVLVAEAGTGRVIEFHRGQQRDAITGFAAAADPGTIVTGAIDALQFVAKELLVVATTSEAGEPELRLYRWTGAAEAQPIAADKWLMRAGLRTVENQPSTESPSSTESTSATASPASSPAAPDPPAAPPVELRGSCRSLLWTAPRLLFLAEGADGRIKVGQCTVNGEALTKIDLLSFADSELPGEPPALETARPFGLLMSPENFLLLAMTSPQTAELRLDFFDAKHKRKTTFTSPVPGKLARLAYGPQRGRLFALIEGGEGNGSGCLSKIVADSTIPSGFRAYPVSDLHHPRMCAFDTQGNLYVLQQSTADVEKFVLNRFAKLEQPPEDK